MGAWVSGILAVGIALLYANAFEWAFHKYVLHGMGRSRKSFWSFHWIDHHRAARVNGFVDPDYRHAPFSAWDAQTKEIAALIAGGVVHLPLLWLSPLAYLTLLYAGVNYYSRHRKAHLDPEWARRKLPWHYDHHMGANQNLNWCVTRPWFDWVMRTRKVYFPTRS